MKIGFHGGRCCGIKHIEGFWGFPGEVNTWIEKPESKKDNHTDKRGEDFKSEHNFCWEAIPTGKTNREWLEFYLDFLKRVRPSGAVEVTLTSIQADIYGWGAVLEELGFKKVVSFWNSNSGNNVFVYYLVYGGKDCTIEAYENDYDEHYDEDENDDDYYEGED